MHAEEYDHHDHHFGVIETPEVLEKPRIFLQATFSVIYDRDLLGPFIDHYLRYGIEAAHVLITLHLPQGEHSVVSEHEM